VHEKIRFDFAVRFRTRTFLTLRATLHGSHTPFVRTDTEEDEETEAHTGKSDVQRDESFLTRIVAAAIGNESSVLDGGRIQAVKAIPTRVEEISTAAKQYGHIDGAIRAHNSRQMWARRCAAVSAVPASFHIVDGVAIAVSCVGRGHTSRRMQGSYAS